MLTKFNGTLSLISNEINNLVEKWMNFVPILCRKESDYHLTVFTPFEIKNNKISLKTQINPKIYDIGIGKQKENVYFIVIQSPELDDLRKFYNLEKKDFHITLSKEDKHDCIKNSSTIFKKEKIHLDLIFEICKRMKINKTSGQNIYDYLKVNVLCEEFIGDPLKILNILNFEKFQTEKCKRYYYVSSGIIKFYESPRNFSFIDSNIFGSAIISNESEIQFILQKGIIKVISLLDDQEYKNVFNKNPNIQFCHFHLKDKTAPSIELLQEIIKSIGNEKVLIHCIGGKGRTATIVIAYLMWKYNIPKKEAKNYLIDRITILSEEQEEFLNNWFSKKEPRLPKKILMIGYPGSGKSVLSKHLENNLNIERYSQDENGRRQIGSGKIIIDKCNLTKDQRREWIEKDTWAIFLNLSKEECLYQASQRLNHLTIKGENVYKKFENIELEEPEKNEGFEKIIRLDNYSMVNDFLLELNVPPIFINEEIIKFPRTKHLLNLGSASRDDLILDKGQVNYFLNVPIDIEEKIDGANLGFSIEKASNKILVQNRSHFINSSYHKQFEKLDNWISKHLNDLFQVIEPGRHILFGEWLYAKHSIHYTKLNDIFLVFDLYDKYKNKFYSRKRLEDKLKNTNLKLVSQIWNNITITSLNQIKNLINTQSNYYNGPVEGIYIRVNSEEFLEYRSKIVRTDFLSSEEHWTKGSFIKNKIIN